MSSRSITLRRALVLAPLIALPGSLPLLTAARALAESAPEAGADAAVLVEEDAREDLDDSEIFVDMTGLGERCSEAVDIDALAAGGDEDLGVEVLPVEPSPEPRAGETDASSDETVVPTRWAPSSGRQCHRYHGRFVCEGPRRVPEPYGEAAERAARLGLGRRTTAGTLLRGPPPQEWLDALGPDPADAPDELHWPVDGGVLWRHFGRVRSRGRFRLHKGVDIGAPYGTIIRAARRGLVAYSDNGVRGYGNMMLIVHADGTTALYGHCQATYVFAGQIVDRGQAIGEVGSTGIARGAHLHFELRKNGQPIDPYLRFEDKAESRAAKLRRARRRRAARNAKRAKTRPRHSPRGRGHPTSRPTP